jgi:hypothetical protein
MQLDDGPTTRMATTRPNRRKPTPAALELDQEAEWLWRVYQSRLRDAMSLPLPPPEPEPVPAAEPVRRKRRALGP